MNQFCNTIFQNFNPRHFEVKPFSYAFSTNENSSFSPFRKIYTKRLRKKNSSVALIMHGISFIQPVYIIYT